MKDCLNKNATNSCLINIHLLLINGINYTILSFG